MSDLHSLAPREWADASAGVHLQWLFALVGILLALVLICLVKVEQYLWLIFLVGVLIAAAMFVSTRLFGSADERDRVSS